MNKDLQYYMSLEYPFQIQKGTDDDGTYYFISYPDLKGCMSHGYTIAEAVSMGVEAKEIWLEDMLERGMKIPEPNELDNYSGNYKVRMPKSLHRQLTLQAEKEGVSMNLLCVTYIAQGLGECNTEEK